MTVVPIFISMKDCCTVKSISCRIKADGCTIGLLSRISCVIQNNFYYILSDLLMEKLPSIEKKGRNKLINEDRSGHGHKRGLIGRTA